MNVPDDGPAAVPDRGGPAGATDLPDLALTDAQRRPLLDDDGRALLRDLLEHPFAPRYNHTCGDRLTARGLLAVRAFAAETATAVLQQPDRPPAWLAGYVDRVARTVPLYRRRGAPPARFEDLPTTSRADLIAEPWSFVPDDHRLDDIVVFTTTGTSDGRVAYIPSTPETTASYAVLLDAALRTRGAHLVGGPGTTAIAQICWQRSTYTYASISTFLGQAGVLKLNLNPADWRHPDDVVRFLEAVDAEVLTGDPVAFARLADLPVELTPKALLSSALALPAGLRARLEARFGCPAIDIYGMNEAGPVAAGLADGTGHVLLQPRLYVEVLGADGRPCPPGERGEITLTGGFNPALPLLRYRTGDTARLVRRGTTPVLADLEGRPPVPFLTADDRAVNTIDITIALHALSAARYTLHQRADRSLELGLDRAPVAEVDRYVAVLGELFGPLPVHVVDLADAPERLTYSTELDAGA